MLSSDLEPDATSKNKAWQGTDPCHDEGKPTANGFYPTSFRRRATSEVIAKPSSPKVEAPSGTPEISVVTVPIKSAVAVSSSSTCNWLPVWRKPPPVRFWNPIVKVYVVPEMSNTLVGKVLKMR